jgi:Fic family protein
MKKHSSFEPFVFERCNSAPPELWLALGEASALCRQLAATPIPPNIANELYHTILSKQTAGQAVTPKPYGCRDLENAAAAANAILDRIEKHGITPITPFDISDYNKRILTGVQCDARAIPGQYRKHSMTVHGSACAPWRQCPGLVQDICDWVNDGGDLPVSLNEAEDGILKAISAHLSLVLVHPFGDGNGRTARLMEFRLLLESGIPASAAQLLSNHYNGDRRSYYAHLELAEAHGERMAFFCYALNGFVDQLSVRLRMMRSEQRKHMALAMELEKRGENDSSLADGDLTLAYLPRGRKGLFEETVAQELSDSPASLTPLSSISASTPFAHARSGAA